MERRVLILRHLLNFTVKFRSGCLVDSAAVFQSGEPDGLKHTEHPQRINVGGEFRRIKRHLHMALCCQIIYLIRAHLPYHLQNRH